MAIQTSCFVSTTEGILKHYGYTEPYVYASAGDKYAIVPHPKGKTNLTVRMDNLFEYSNQQMITIEDYLYTVVLLAYGRVPIVSFNFPFMEVIIKGKKVMGVIDTHRKHWTKSSIPQSNSIILCHGTAVQNLPEIYRRQRRRKGSKSK